MAVRTVGADEEDDAALSTPDDALFAIRRDAPDTGDPTSSVRSIGGFS